MAIERVVDGDAGRRASASRSQIRATAVGARLPLVHRTAKPTDFPATAGTDGDSPSSSWLDLLSGRAFTAKKPCTSREEAAGIPRAAYFFLGCGAFPDGLVGFVLNTTDVLARPASFTPFDSGALEKYAVPTDAAVLATWDNKAKDRFLIDYLGDGRDASTFAGLYLAAHFDDPMSYVRRPQQSRPDFAAYHGLESTSGDRRSWTIEVHTHDNVVFGPGGSRLEEIVVARKELLDELPDDLLSLARVATAENEVLESIAEGIEARISAEVP